jgi:hypothetical protein
LAFVHEGSARQGYLPSRAIRGMRRLAKLGGKIRERSSFSDSVRLPPRESQALEAACFGFELTARSAWLPLWPGWLGIELPRSEDLHVLLSKAAAKAVVEATSRASVSRFRQSGRCSFHQRGFASIIGEKCRFSQGNSVRHHADHDIVAAFQGDGCGWP